MTNNNKNTFLNEDDFNISITNEQHKQELTIIGETGKSSGIINAINFPHFNISLSNKNKLYSNHLELINQKLDNYNLILFFS